MIERISNTISLVKGKLSACAELPFGARGGRAEGVEVVVEAGLGVELEVLVADLGGSEEAEAVDFGAEIEG